MTAEVLLLLAVTAGAFVLGSVSVAWIVGRCHGIDLRQHGSGNLGATNAGRVLGLRWFFIVFAGDMGKGLIAVVLARFLAKFLGWSPAQVDLAALAAAVGVVLGHSFTCFHRFRGGKAVATSLGVLIALLPWVAGIALAVWILVWLVGRLCGLRASMAVAPASVLAAFAVPVARCLTSPHPWHRQALPGTLLSIALGVLVVARHRSNIQGWFRRPASTPAPGPGDPAPGPSGPSDGSGA